MFLHRNPISPHKNVHSFPMLGDIECSYIRTPYPLMGMCIAMLGNIEHSHMQITCLFMGTCVPMLKNTRNIWQLVMHWERTFLCGIFKCSSRTCPFVGIHIPKLGNIECSQLGTPCSVMGNIELFNWGMCYSHMQIFVLLFPHKNVCSYIFPNIRYMCFHIAHNVGMHLGNFGPQVSTFNIVLLVWIFCPHVKMARPHACEPPMFPKELEPTFKLYVACSLNLQIMMPIQNAKNRQGDVFTLLRV